MHVFKKKYLRYAELFLNVQCLARNRTKIYVSIWPNELISPDVSPCVHPKVFFTVFLASLQDVIQNATKCLYILGGR
jgi:hypothetical protein